MPFTLVQLRSFVLTVQEGKVIGAADRMGLSQPTVSFHLANLEHAAGQPLFFSGSRRPDQLTPFGRTLYRYAERLVTMEHSISDLIDDTRALTKGLVRLGSTHTPATFFLPQALAAFWRYYPEVDVSLDVSPARLLLPRVLSFGVDLCLINHFPSSMTEVEAEPLLQDSLVAAMHPGHPLSERPELCAEDFARCDFISHEPGSVSRRAIDQWFELHRTQPKVRIEVSSTETMKEMVKNQLGVAIVSSLSCARDCQNGLLVTRPVHGMMDRHSRVIYLIRVREPELSPTAQALVDTLKVTAVQMQSASVAGT